VTSPFVRQESPSLDHLCLLSLAALLTVLWSVIDRKRANYIRMHKWFREYLRFALATTLLSYGIARRFRCRCGPSSHPIARTLWKLLADGRALSIRSVPRCHTSGITGCAELTAAALLFIPRIATLGAIVVRDQATELFRVWEAGFFVSILLLIVVVAKSGIRVAKSQTIS
jgi:hypothetical protein